MDLPFLDQLYNAHALELPPPELPHRSYGLPQPQLEAALLNFNPLDPAGGVPRFYPVTAELLALSSDEA